MRIFTLFAGVGCFLFAGAFGSPNYSQGDGCRSLVVQPSYSYRAPAFQQQYQQQVIQVPVQADYYYTVQDYYRDKLLLDAFAGRLVDLQQKGLFQQEDKQYTKILEFMLQLQLKGQFQGQGQLQLPAELQQKPPPPKVQQSPQVPQELQQSLESNKCLKCHNDANRKGGLSLESGLDGMNELLRLRMYALVSSGEMPQGHPPVPQEQLKYYYDFWSVSKK